MQPAELRRILRENIHARRLELGISQSEAAARAQITQAYWAMLEAGLRVPQLDKLAAIADALQTTPNALLSERIFSKNFQPQLLTAHNG